MIALIDADILLYSIPFTLQEGYGDEAVLEPDAMLYLGPRIDNAIDKILTGSGCSDYELYLTGDGNFRCDVATLQPYKGGRPSRPLLYEAAKEYMFTQHPTVLSYGCEADDAIAIAHMDDPEVTVICTIDKDLDNVPGAHYRWPIIRKEEEVSPAKLYDVHPDEARYNFWVQMLTGDSVDKILGVPGVGKKKAEKMLDMLMDEATQARLVFNEYIRYYTDKKPELGINPMDAFMENGNLIWICQERDDNYLPVTFSRAKGYLLDDIINPDPAY